MFSYKGVEQKLCQIKGLPKVFSGSPILGIIFSLSG